MEKILTISEKEVLKYLQSIQHPVVKSHVGIAVGKRIPKNAAIWAHPILERLVELDLIETFREGSKILYAAKQVEEKLLTETNKNQEEKLLTNTDTFQEPEIPAKEEKLLTETDTENEDLEEKLLTEKEPKVKVAKPTKKKHVNLPNRLDKEFEKAELLKEWETIKDKKDVDKKRHITNFLKNSIKSKLENEKSMNSNSVKSFIVTLVHEVTTGTPREFKNDGREFEVGQKVRYINKHKEEKIGKIVKIFLDNVFYQRTIVVVEDGQTTREMKVDRKILGVIS